MKKKIGLALMATSVVVGVVLAITGDLAGVTQTKVDHQAFGNISVATATISIDPNWWLAVPFIVSFIAGLVCVGVVALASNFSPLISLAFCNWPG
jgi:hypothetical protein